MSEIVFARTRHVYDSYVDFWRLAELSGFPIVYIDEIDYGDRTKTYLTAPFNGEYFQLGERRRRCKVILWNLERPASSGGIDPYRDHLREHISNKFIDEVVVSDVTLSKIAGFKYVPLGSHRGLGAPGDTKTYDYIHLMCYSNRRGILFKTPSEPKELYSGCSIAQNGWGEERHQRLQQSKFMLNVHQDTDMIMEPLRFALAAAYGLPMLTENLYETSHPYGDRIYQFPLDSMGQAMRMALHNYNQFSIEAAALRGLMIGPYSFRNCIERYL